MKPFQTLTSHVLPLPRTNVDTDQIIPAKYLKVTDKSGLAEGLFANWRYLEDGTPDPSFALNDSRHDGAEILVAGDNFGCGSSREHAPWALVGYGFRAVISPRFADIFRNNALKNGLLPVAVPEATCQRILQFVEADAAARVTVDLEAEIVTLPDGEEVPFEVDAFGRRCLLDGVDQLGYLLARGDAISTYEARMESRP